MGEQWLLLFGLFHDTGLQMFLSSANSILDELLCPWAPCESDIDFYHTTAILPKGVSSSFSISLAQCLWCGRRVNALSVGYHNIQAILGNVTDKVTNRTKMDKLSGAS